MSTAEQAKQHAMEPAYDGDPSGTVHRAGVWWLIWVPAIVVVVMWIAGWSFGNYGGPWESKPQYIEPKITDAAVAMLSFGEASGIPASGHSHS